MSGDVALAAPHPAAVEAGRAAVAAGGNALDAALAAAAALTVVYPHQCSIGGDLTAVVRPAGGGARAVLSLGAAAAAIDVDALRAGGATAMPERGPSTVTVPGVVAGWAAVAALGARLGWAERLRPAIALARDGAPVSAGLARAIRGGRAVIDADPGLSAVFGDAREGTLLTQPALAGSLRELARRLERPLHRAAGASPRGRAAAARQPADGRGPRRAPRRDHRPVDRVRARRRVGRGSPAQPGCDVPGRTRIRSEARRRVARPVGPRRAARRPAHRPG
nr:hypothetical protein GCM10020092_063840 [Actinoplanes digitatis]